MKELQFIAANVGGLEPGSLTTTARKGKRWFNEARVGERVMLMQVPDRKVLGSAVITTLTLTNFKDVVARRAENHQGAEVAEALASVYGKIEDSEPFTIVGLVVLQPE